LLIDRENLVEDNENGIETANCADFFLINYIGRSAEDFAGGNEIGNGENDIEIADCADFFFINHIDRGAEGFAGNGENNIEIADCENFFFANYINRCAVSLHSANLIIIIAIVKTANIYRF
jgi:hypothetical protein